MANGGKITRDHKRSIKETGSGCYVCLGPQSIFKPLGKWACEWGGCKAGNDAHMAYCHVKGCNGLPPLEHRESQAEAQQKHEGLKVGAAPYVPPAKRGAKGGAKG